jgi:hypothetical protein
MPVAAARWRKEALLTVGSLMYLESRSMAKHGGSISVASLSVFSESSDCAPSTAAAVAVPPAAVSSAVALAAAVAVAAAAAATGSPETLGSAGAVGLLRRFSIGLVATGWAEAVGTAAVLVAPSAGAASMCVL